MNFKSVATLIFTVTLFATNSFAGNDCQPITNDGSESTTLISGTEKTSSDSAIIMSAAESKYENHIATTSDLFGASITQVWYNLEALTSVTVDETSYNTQKEMYCSRSTSAAAQCQEACHRWSNFEGVRP